MGKDEYETISQDKWYKPQNKIQFQQNVLSVFDGENTKERKFVAWEVKEATLKNSLGLLGVYMFDVMVPLGQVY